MPSKKSVKAWSEALLAPPPPPEGALDIAWKLARAGVEEGRNRYGIDLYVAVRPEHGRFIAKIDFVDLGSRWGKVFEYSYTELLDAIRIEALAMRIDDFLRELAEKRDKNANKK